MFLNRWGLWNREWSMFFTLYLSAWGNIIQDTYVINGHQVLIIGKSSKQSCQDPEFHVRGIESYRLHSWFRGISWIPNQLFNCAYSIQSTGTAKLSDHPNKRPVFRSKKNITGRWKVYLCCEVCRRVNIWSIHPRPDMKPVCLSRGRLLHSKFATFITLRLISQSVLYHFLLSIFVLNRLRSRVGMKTRAYQSKINSCKHYIVLCQTESGQAASLFIWSLKVEYSFAY